MRRNPHRQFVKAGEGSGFSIWGIHEEIHKAIALRPYVQSRRPMLSIRADGMMNDVAD
jgi:hypothetical protein